MSKYCPECGTKLDGENKFCPECGEKVSIWKEVNKNDENVAVVEKNIIDLELHL